MTEIAKIQQNLEKACDNIWNESKKIPKKYGYDDDTANFIVQLALVGLYLEMLKR